MITRGAGFTRRAVIAGRARVAGLHVVASGGVATGQVVVTRRGLQIALGMLWLIDGLLQAQPFMFTSDFATQVIAPVGQGQPGFVADPVHRAATVIAAHPAAWTVPFALIQLLLGVGLLVRPTARVTLVASIAWALGVWYLGEGLGGLASGQTSMITGAPGSAALLAIMAAAALPSRGGDGSREAPAPWLPFAWGVLWVGAAVFQALPAQAGDYDVPLVAVMVAAMYLIGLGALVPATRVPALALGLALTLGFWVFGQDLGDVFSGQATDPDSGPVLALMAIALLAGAGLRRGVDLEARRAEA